MAETKKKRTKPKADDLEVARRVDEVLRIRLDGAQYHDVLQYVTENGWNLKERMIREYMARADDLLIARQDKDQAKLIAMHLARREAMLARAINAADYRVALSILDSMAKLQGLVVDKVRVEEVTQVEVKVEIVDERPAAEVPAITE